MNMKLKMTEMEIQMVYPTDRWPPLWRQCVLGVPPYEVPPP